ncbi:uncharacterized protein FMAN_14282 [Fusarium mangiferae]|uniref:ferric-chelate reductase (NADPH) n=1 Tax=Fusarium mangiferae TaxID=192010 RepID=A0A1L7UEB2_FUSMA|nr:uncharacterized protein FMAN_14282 [Fusarium mangiferae]CVL09004.1 uncharacterized protein FMAN_14282 [Fusarium mangiferae]
MYFSLHPIGLRYLLDSMQLLPTTKDVFGSTTGLYTIGIIALLILLALRPVIIFGLKLALSCSKKPLEFAMLIRVRRRVTGWAMRRILYRKIFRRGSSLDTYTRAQIMFIMFHLSINFAFILVNISSSEEVFSRAGKLAIANAILLYLGPGLDFSTSVLRIGLRAQKQLHASAGYVVVVLSILHAAGAFSKRGWLAVEQIRDLLPALALLGICSLVLPLRALATFLPYELVLFVHNTLALLSGYAIWCHVPADQQLVRATLCVIAGIFLLLLLTRVLIMAYRNHFWFQSISFEQNGTSRYVRIVISLRRPLRVEPGQYINLWTPTTLSSVLQSHPFSIGNCSSEVETQLRMVVDVKRGFTNNLRELAKRCMTSNIAIFAGPYGSRIPVENYETVLLVATGLGFVALSPYLQWLVRAAHNKEIKINPVHLVWQVSSWEQFCAVYDLLGETIQVDNKASGTNVSRENNNTQLQEDKTYVKTSIYYDENGIPPDWAKDMIEQVKKMRKRWKRVHLYEYQMPLADILRKEAATKAADSSVSKPKLIAASVSGDVRDDLVQFATAKSSLFDLIFTDYQPEDDRHSFEDPVNQFKSNINDKQADAGVPLDDSARGKDVRSSYESRNDESCGRIQEFQYKTESYSKDLC